MNRLLIIATHLTIANLVMHYVARLAVKGHLVPQFTLTNTFESKLQLLALYASLHAFIQMLALLLVALGRLSTGAHDPFSGLEHLVEVRRRVQVNTFEQSVLSLLAQFSLLPHLPIDVLVPLFATMNALFAMGRLAFWLGYPKHRTFGFSIGFIPSGYAILYSVHRFALTLGLLEPSQKRSVDQFIQSFVRYMTE